MAEQADPLRRKRARRTLLLLTLICAAPVIASYAAYYWLRPAAHVNYGELLAKPAPDIAGIGDDGTAWRLASLHGRWVLLVASDAACDARCAAALYATRQARTIQGREQERLVRVLLLPAEAPPLDAALRAQHPGLIVARASPAQWAPSALGAATSGIGIVLVDPLGNLVLRYPAEPDIKRLAKDLERLLRASRIG
jgi:cytochrome oxidase Cu insertion factor (SCO1/SenC/PrrC family)